MVVVIGPDTSFYTYSEKQLYLCLHGSYEAVAKEAAKYPEIFITGKITAFSKTHILRLGEMNIPYTLSIIASSLLDSAIRRQGAPIHSHPFGTKSGQNNGLQRDIKIIVEACSQSCPPCR